ncbi:hypothetical protein OG196_43605 (plasmid) [Kitasatospora purpeofusca]|uniref:hypothetical protein n=1 Tax=Kitasatospora purpeofusca TaxID=67352 RepID=UPI002E15014F|nr:hypothetical protein OG196_43605 [Kitasatospora purpeofusca]
MPSEGRPRAIDTAHIATPADVPPAGLISMAQRRDTHLARALGRRQDLGSTTAADPLAALALGVAITKEVLHEQRLLVQAAVEQGCSWEEIAAALDTSAITVRDAFTSPAGNQAE